MCHETWMTLPKSSKDKNGLTFARSWSWWKELLTTKPICLCFVSPNSHNLVDETNRISQPGHLKGYHIVLCLIVSHRLCDKTQNTAPKVEERHSTECCGWSSDHPQHLANHRDPFIIRYLIITSTKIRTTSRSRQHPSIQATSYFLICWNLCQFMCRSYLHFCTLYYTFSV